jgi:ubiquinone/menaquinone biosynthesis C-methylase UbiE
VSLAAWTDSQLTVIKGLNGRVLEACCGTGQLLVEMLKRGIDLPPNMVEVTRHRLTAAQLDPQRVYLADITALPFDDRSFDYAVVAGSMGLLPLAEKRAVLQELVRVCRTEVRLLEPLEKRPGFYFGRLLTLMVDGPRPIPQSLFSEPGLACVVQLDTMAGIFSCIRVPAPRG